MNASHGAALAYSQELWRTQMAIALSGAPKSVGLRSEVQSRRSDATHMLASLRYDDQTDVNLGSKGSLDRCRTIVISDLLLIADSRAA
jgi:hypothetical protein